MMEEILGAMLAIYKFAGTPPYGKEGSRKVELRQSLRVNQSEARSPGAASWSSPLRKQFTAARSLHHDRHH